MKKRIAILLLVACLALTLMPVTTLAAQPGDVNGDGVYNTDDAVYLLMHILFGSEDFPIPESTNMNFDGRGTVDSDDAVYLLFNAMFSDEDYPLYPEEESTDPTTPEEIALAEAEIRRALSLLIDRNTLVRDVTGSGELPANTLVGEGALDFGSKSFVANANNGNGYYSVDPTDYRANRQEAINILKKYYTYDGTKFTDFPTLHYIYNTNNSHEAIAEYLQATLADVGITMIPNSVDWGALLNSRMEGNYTVARNGWVSDTSNPISFLNSHTSISNNNESQLGKGGHANIAIYDLDLTPYGYNIKVTDGTWAETYDVLIDTIYNCTDAETRFALMHLAEDMLMQTGVVIPLYYYTQLYLLDDGVEGLYANPTGLYFFQKTVSDDDILRICLTGDPYDLDPAAISALDAMTITSHLFSGLARWDTDAQGNLVITADCATSLPAGVKNQDGSVTYTYTLRSGMRWSDGTPLTAYDFEYAWKRASANNNGFAYGYLFEDVKGFGSDDGSQLAVTAKNAATLEVTLTRDVPYWNELLAHPVFFPVREAVAEDNSSWGQSASTLVTNGPYKLTEWDAGSSLTMTKNTAYHNAGSVTMDTLQFHFTYDTEEMLRQFDNGAWQMVNCYPNGDLPQLQARYGTKLHTTGITGTYYANFNIQFSLLD